MWRLSVFALIATVTAQIPSLGWCPDYLPMANFNMKNFLGTWYEAERYFTVSELVSRCVTTKYESTPEGRILVSNEITNSLTGMKRVMDGHLQLIGREGEGRIIVKYSALPIPYDTEYAILDTDYDTYAVLWSCSGIGPVHTQNAWVLTRDRLAPIAVMQAAYGVLDRNKISRTFFVKTNQADCYILPDPATKTQVEGKNAPAVDVVVEEKSVGVVPEAVVKVEKPVEKRVDPEVKPEVPVERSAVTKFEEPSKPMKVPEFIMSEPEKKEDKFEKKEEKFEKKEEKFDKKEDKFEKKEDKFEKREDKFEKKEDKFEKKEDKFEKKEDKFEKKEEKFEKKEDKFEKPEEFPAKLDFPEKMKMPEIKESSEKKEKESMKLDKPQ